MDDDGPVWVIFRVPTPTPDGRSARDLYEDRVQRITDPMRRDAAARGCTFHRAWYAADGSAFWALAHWTSRAGAQAFYDAWEIGDEPGEEGWRLEGDVGLVPLG